MTTVAGSTRPLNDGGAATGALLYNPQGIVLDSAGNIYFADQGNHRVRKIDTAGRISTIAGNGTRGYRGDGGPATAAALIEPSALALDNAGTLYITDAGGDAVRKVSASGTITTFAGTGIAGFSGDGGSPTAAKLNQPRGVAVDSAGNVYIADTGNNRVRKVTSGTITTIAGTGQDASSRAGGPAATIPVSEPSGLAIDAAGNLYLSETGTGRISKLDTRGQITPFAGTFNYNFSSIGDNGPALNATLGSPEGLAFDAAGNLYYADAYLNRIRKINPTGTITTLTGTGVQGYSGDGGPAGAAQIFEPFGVAADSAGNVYFTDAVNQRVRKVNQQTLTIATLAGSAVGLGDGGPATQAQLFAPSGQAVDAAGNLFIADTNNHRVRKVSPAGTVTTVAGTGSAGYGGDGGPATQAPLNSPSSVYIDSLGQLIITDTGNSAIRRVGLNGTIQTIAGNGSAGFEGDSGPAARAQLAFPSAARMDASGNLYIADTGNSRIRVISQSGTITTFAGSATGKYGDGGPASAATLIAPSGVAPDGKGNVYIADLLDSTIRKVGPDGIISTLNNASSIGFAGDGGPVSAALLFLPYDVAVDSAGNLYVSDAGNARIREISTSGIISTIAGTGAFGFAGDSGPALAAQFGFIGGLALDFSGNVYVADSDNHRIRKLTKSVVVPDFSLSADAATKSVNAGASVVTTLTLVSINGFTGNVSLSSSGLPANAVTFAPGAVVSLGAGQTAVVTATVSFGAGMNATAQGIFVAASGAIQHQTTVNYTVSGSGPIITSNAIVNAASFASGPVAPGEIVTIYGSGIGPDTLTGLQLDSSGRIATTVAQATVTFDGVPAPLLYVSASQLSAIVPYAVAGKSSTAMQVMYSGKSSAVVPVAVTGAVPALFTANSSGAGPLAALNQDGSLNSAANPAAAGTSVVLYGTGEGQTTPGGVDGQIAASVYPAPVVAPTVTVGGQAAQVLYAGAAPGLVAGVIQFNVVIPAGLASGPADVIVNSGSAASPMHATIAIQ